MWNGLANRHLYAQGRWSSDFGGHVGRANSISGRKSVRAENMATHGNPRPSVNSLFAYVASGHALLVRRGRHVTTWIEYSG